MAKTLEIGTKFKNLCVMGLNRVEYFPEGSEEAIFADTWHDVTDDQSRRNMALMFFAPRDLDGEPVDPYLYLTETDNEDDEQSVLIAHQSFGDIPLLDMCRMHQGPANTLQVLIAADVIYHWDMKDCYVQPTNPMTWVRDLQIILKNYPHTTDKIVYTNWDNSKLTELGVSVRPVQDLIVEEQVWINKPSFQEKHGYLLMMFSLFVALFVYIFIYMQESKIDDLSAQIRQVDTETPSGKNYPELNRALAEQQSFMRNRTLLPLVVRDISFAIQSSGLKLDSLQIKSTDPKTPTDVLIATIKAEKGAYSGWLEEEPIAKALLGQSVTMSAIRRPPGGQQFTLEGLVELEPIATMVANYQDKIQRSGQQSLNLFEKSSKESVPATTEASQTAVTETATEQQEEAE